MGLRAVLRQLDVHDGRAFYRSVRSRPLKPVARVFVWANTKVAHLLALPVDLVGRQLFALQALAGKQAPGAHGRRQRRAPDSFAIDAEREITLLKRRDRHYARGIQILLQAAAVTAWTTAEYCLEDVWVTCVSERPGHVPAEMISKVRIDAAALFSVGLDARNRLGELLASSGFSFDNPASIKRAYDALFGTGSHPNLAVAIQQLHTLNEVRNLIVHRGGIVDKRFRERTHYRTRVGRPFLLSERSMVDYANASTRACKAAITFADQWLRASRRHRGQRGAP